jgi:hypothetical protein
MTKSKSASMSRSPCRVNSSSSTAWSGRGRPQPPVGREEERLGAVLSGETVGLAHERRRARVGRVAPVGLRRAPRTREPQVLPEAVQGIEDRLAVDDVQMPVRVLLQAVDHEGQVDGDDGHRVLEARQQVVQAQEGLIEPVAVDGDVRDLHAELAADDGRVRLVPGQAVPGRERLAHEEDGRLGTVDHRVDRGRPIVLGVGRVFDVARVGQDRRLRRLEQPAVAVVGLADGQLHGPATGGVWQAQDAHPDLAGDQRQHHRETHARARRQRLARPLPRRPPTHPEPDDEQQQRAHDHAGAAPHPRADLTVRVDRVNHTIRCRWQ